MMPSTTTYIEFKRKRELGDIITDAFKFLRQNFKMIFKILAKTAGIPFALFIVAQAYYTAISFSSVFAQTNNPFGIFETTSILVSALFMYLFLFLYFSFMFTAITCTIKSYVDNKGIIKETEVIDHIRTKIGATLLAGTAKFFILALAFVVCFIPVIYFSVPLYLLFAVLIFENKNVSDAIGSAFDIVKEEWWITFFTMFLIGLLWYVASLVLNLPTTIYVWIKTFTTIQEVSYSDIGGSYDILAIVFTTVSASLQYLLYIIVPIGASFVYYNLNERKHQTGTLERIDSIGASDDDDDEEINSNNNFSRL
ncbi:hypothetical protein [uncultured Dokdonia sp.]|uniref:hypothetical protein n=1 Tax=uncultured Dokdonia sp. TaxID=575653 RepID=UPI0026084DE8|nr:hypothetical protein [uncultured Dokdonia sp.]